MFAATHYSRLRDAGINGKQLVSQASQLLVLLADEFKNTTRDLPNFLLDICLAQRAVEVGTLSKYDNDAPPLIYDAIKERCRSRTYPFFYGDFQFSNSDKAAQQKLFRSDVAAHLELSRNHIKDLSALDPNTRLLIDTVAMFLLEFTKKSLNREEERTKPAELYAKLIAASNAPPQLTIRFCLQHFTALLEDRLKPQAAQILARQLATSHPGLSRLVAETATSQLPLSGTTLSQDERHQLTSDLQRGVGGAELLLRFLVRPYVVEDVIAIKEVNSAIPVNTPEWLLTLFVSGRLNAQDMESFLCASQRMKEQLGTATTVSIDLGFFSWPRITEIAALTRARDLLIHSDLPFSSQALENGDPITQAAMSALARKKPNFLPFMALMSSAEEVIAREKAWLHPPEVRDTNALDFSYEADEGVRKALINLRDGTSVQQRVSQLLGRHMQAPCFIVEGSRPGAPRAFGVLGQRLMLNQLTNFTVENIGDISLFFNKDAAILTGRDLKELVLPKVKEEKAHQPAPPPSQTTLVTISAETREQAAAALTKASRYGGIVEANGKAAPVIALLRQISTGRCPAVRDLRITRAMQHDLHRNAVTGGVHELFENTLPILTELAETARAMKSQK